MVTNTFMPKGLPLLSDAALIKTMSEYGKSYAALAHSVFPSAARLRKEIGLAMLAIERELETRGINTSARVQEVLCDVSPLLFEETTEPIARQARLTV